MSMNKKLYPSDWPSISRRIREREGNCCKFCGVKNGSIGARDYHGEWHDELDIHHMNSGYGEALFPDGFPKMTRIVLTVAHLGTPHSDGTSGNKHDKMDCRDENLAALCQKCHLAYDMEDHIRKRRITLARKKLATITASGQLALFEV